MPRHGASLPPSADGKTFGQRLRELRGQLRQEDASKLLDISTSQLANLEVDRFRPSIENLLTLSRVYGVSIDWLLGNQVGRKRQVQKGVVRETREKLGEPAQRLHLS